MIRYQDVRNVHLEISSLCNASCPWCPRTFWGYPYNGGYPEVNLTLENAKKIFSPDFLKQLVKIKVNGNFGDIVMNPQGPEIIEYFYLNNLLLNFLKYLIFVVLNNLIFLFHLVFFYIYYWYLGYRYFLVVVIL